MKKFLPLFVFYISVSLLNAQSYNRCGTHELMLAKEQYSPGYMDRVNACFENAKRIAALNKSNRAANDTVYHVRLVFHVVYTTPQENIPDSVIYSQIEVLNEDYRRLNADTERTRDIFKPFAGDAHMEFYLATTDPDGNPTNGITRTHGNPGLFGFDPFSDNVKSDSTGGKDPWPTDRYVNVWVCNVLFGLGVLGYSFPPDNAPNWPNGSTTDSTKQGVVLHFPVVGRNFSAPIDPTVTKGRSLTHELGHYFGLRHIWGDGDCSVDDGISDTPDANAAHQQTCDTMANTCVDTPYDYPDMIENYMDYSDDRCLNMFTNEQIGIMHAMLQTSRAGVATAVITGISNIENNFDAVAVYPNPSTGTVTLNVKLNSSAARYRFEIFNTAGSKLLSSPDYHESGGIHSVNLADKPGGIYYAKIYSGGQSVVRKFSIVK